MRIAQDCELKCTSHRCRTHLEAHPSPSRGRHRRSRRNRGRRHPNQGHRHPNRSHRHPSQDRRGRDRGHPSRGHRDRDHRHRDHRESHRRLDHRHQDHGPPPPPGCQMPPPPGCCGICWIPSGTFRCDGAAFATEARPMAERPSAPATTAAPAIFMTIPVELGRARSGITSAAWDLTQSSSQLAATFLLGCTRGGSPGIFG